MKQEPTEQNVISGQETLDLEKGRTDGWHGVLSRPDGSKSYLRGYAEGMSARAWKFLMNGMKGSKAVEQAVQRQSDDGTVQRGGVHEAEEGKPSPARPRSRKNKTPMPDVCPPSGSDDW